MGATVLCLALAAILLIPARSGYQRYVIVSGSMTGTYDQGSIVFDREVPVADLKVGDVITYQPPARHLLPRICSPTGSPGSAHNKRANEIFRTKGDANPSADPWTFNLEKPDQAKVDFSIPYVGFLLAALSIPIVRMLAIGIPGHSRRLADPRRHLARRRGGGATAPGHGGEPAGPQWTG